MKNKSILKKELFEQSKYFYFNSKVVSRNIITDWIQGIRNFLGLWFFIDVLEIRYRNVVRIMVLGTIFLVTHYVYKRVGYAK